ncbi:hypothetical protein [Streptomyces sp. NPDC048192]|uniref:hypothetical protein n=1 Tax=Streptomyces sp. NPDC048192 TaxID=3365510 RepID=UPI003715A9AD
MRGDLFSRVLAAVNSHRTNRQPSRARRVTAPDAALGTHLLATVRAQDAAVPANRRVPRTVSEMRGRLDAAALTEEESDACGVCGYWRCRCGQACAQVPAPTAGFRSATVLNLTDAEREELSRRVAEENKRSEQRPR